MTAETGASVRADTSAAVAGADASAEASIVSEVSLASASATATRTHQRRAATELDRARHAQLPLRAGDER